MIEAAAHAVRYVRLFVSDWPRTKRITCYGPVARAFYAHLYAIGEE